MVTSLQTMKGQGLTSRQVNGFLESRSGIYWAATDKGLCRFIPDVSTQANRNGSRDSSSRTAIRRATSVSVEINAPVTVTCTATVVRAARKFK